MLARLRPRLTFANVCSFLALLIALGTGSAYAANTVFSTDIVDGEVKSVDIGTNQIRSVDVRDDTLPSGGLAEADLGFDSVGSGEIQTNAVQASEVADGAIDSGEIADNTLTAADLAASSVGTSEVASNSLTAFDLAGGESNGSITLSAGYVANGACRDGTIAVGSAVPGDAVLFSINGSVPQGILISGVRVSSANTVVVKVCNFTGAPMAAITDLQVAVVTITI